jgi:hypothetical protein
MFSVIGGKVLVAGTRAVDAWAIALSSATAHAVHSRELCALSLKADLELPALQTFRTFSRKSTNSPTCNRIVILQVKLCFASHFSERTFVTLAPLVSTRMSPFNKEHEVSL